MKTEREKKKKGNGLGTVTCILDFWRCEDAVNTVYVLLCCALSAVLGCFSLAPPVCFKDHLYLHLLPLRCMCMHMCARVCVFVYAHIVGL